MNCAQTFGLCGQHKRARDFVDRYLQIKKGKAKESFFVASAYLAMRDTNTAYAWLGTAYNERSYVLGSLRVDPMWESQAWSPRYRAMLRNVGLDK